MSSSSGLSVQDIAAGIDTTTNTEQQQQEPVPTSPTTITSTTTTSTSTSVLSSSSSVSPNKRSNNLVRRLRLRGGADESYLKLKSLNAGISSSGGIFSSPSPNKSPSTRAKSRNGSKGDDEEEDDNNVYPRPNPNAKFKKRFIFVELDEQGQIIDRRGNNKTTRTSSSYRTDESTLRQRGDGHNDTIGRTSNHNHNSSSPLAVAAEHLSSTLSHNPLFQLRFRKQKRLLVKDIPTDDGEYTRSRIIALRQWAESLGAVRRLLRSIPDGTIWIEFKDREVAENVCHLHAHVHIPNVGRVRLDWVEGREAG
ncbi:hypothetical protein Clacol_004493 [Clathrus columnatus]|uniref:Uncharacterized protein n=1 Tax=Clathrus columnatus TaxID=1419009 RepID=A0AAV5A995_9AGAM|nr:hypothetical protein Clacol_004493 [Clathrus columnatus]